MKHLRRPLRSKKADMTIPVIVAIVLGLALMILSLYIIMGRGRIIAKVGACPDNCGQCNYGNPPKCDNPCPNKEQPTKGLTPCKIGGDEKKPGRCCTDLI